MRTFSQTTLTTGWTGGRTDGQKIAKQFAATLGLRVAARVNDLTGFCILKFKSPNTSLIKFCITFAKVYVSLNQVNSSAASVALSYTDWCVHSNATALTVDNITSALNGIDWETIGLNILRLPDSKYYEITEQFSSDDDRTRAAVRKWLLRDPLASWRRVINQLYLFSEAELADSILHYAEELTGMYMIMIMIHTTLHHMMHGKCTREKVTGL